MDDLLLTLVFSIIVMIATVIALAVCGLLYRHLQVPSPLRLLAASIERFRGTVQSSVPLFMRSLRRGLSSAYILTPLGTRTAADGLTISYAPEDGAEMERQGVIDRLPRMAGEAYGVTASRNGWSDLRPTIGVYLIEDLSCQPNRPRVTTGRPRGWARLNPFIVSTGETLEPAGPRAGASATAGRAAYPAAPTAADISKTTPMGDNPETAPAADIPCTVPVSNISGPIPMPGSRPSAPGPQGRPSGSDQIAGSLGTAVAVDIERTAAVTERALLVCDGRIVCRVTDLGVQIGRSESNDLVVRDPSVSRQHAALNYRDGQLVLEPVAGRLCWVNDVSVAGPTMVQIGDRLRFSSSPISYGVESGRK